MILFPPKLTEVERWKMSLGFQDDQTQLIVSSDWHYDNLQVQIAKLQSPICHFKLLQNQLVFNIPPFVIQIFCGARNKDSKTSG